MPERRWFILVLALGLSCARDGFAQPEPTPRDPSTLQSRIRDLQSALQGEPPSESLEELLGVDPSRPDAVSQRRRELAKLLDGAVPTSSTSTTPQALTVRLAQLQRAFLEKPKAFRDALVDAETARRQAERDRERAEARAAAAARAAELAEKERREALEDARRARTALLREIEERRADVAAWSKALSDLHARVSKESEARSEELSAASRAIQRLLTRVLRAETSTSAHALYRRVVPEWEGASRQLGGALERVERPVDLPPAPAIALDRSVATSTAAAARWREVEAALADAQRLRSELSELEAQARVSSVRGWAQLLASASLARSTALAQSTSSFRLQEIGWTGAGLRNLQLELQASAHAVRAYVQLWIDELSRPGLQMARDELFRRSWPWLKSLLVVVVAGWLWSRVRPLRERIRAAQAQARNLTKLRRLALADRLVEQFVGPVVFVASCEVVARLLRADERGPELMVVLVVARWFGLFWLLRRALSTLVLWLARRRRAALPRRLRLEIEASVLRASRAFIFAAAARQLAVYFFGTSALTRTIETGLLVFVALVAFSLLRRWRETVAKAYLSAFPDGRLARAVEAHQNRTYGLGVVFFAFVAVTIRSGAQLIREGVLRIEQIRRALAFIFRLRLQRSAEDSGDGETDATADLQPSVRQAFTLDAVEDDALRIDRFPGLDDVLEDAPRTVSLIGDMGAGKTTWLLRYRARLEGDVTWVDCGRPTSDPAAASIVAHLAGQSDRPAWTDDGPPTAIVIDDFHRLLLRAPGGLDPLDRLMAWTEAPDGPKQWVVSVHGPFWRWATAARPYRVRFRREVKLEPWSEEEIRFLLMARAAASGVVHDFGELVSDATNEEAIARSGEGFTRLIWDASDGSPRVALFEWCRSLAPAGPGRVRIRLSRGPDTGRLFELDDPDWRLLAALMLHDGLTPEAGAKVLRRPPDLAAAQLDRLADLGMLIKEDSGRYRASYRWERPIERQVRRRHLL